MYDDSTEDTGPTAAPDSLDDRFASAKRTVGGRRGVTVEPGDEQAPPTVPAQRVAGVPAEGTRAAASKRWPWDEEDEEPLEADDDASPTRHPTTRPDLTTPPSLAAPETPDAPYALDALETPQAPPASQVSEVPPVPQSPPVPQAPPMSPGAPVSQVSEAPHVPQGPPVSQIPAVPPVPQNSPVPPVPQSPPVPPVPQSPPVPPVPRISEVPSGPSVAQFSVGSGGWDDPDVGVVPVAASASSVDYVSSGPPTYDAEPTALPAADPDELDDLVADTVLDGARYGACTLRAVSQRGDSARFRGEPRRDALLTARFGTGEQALVLVAMATGARATPGAHRAAAEVCEWIARAVGRSHQRLTEDIQAARRGDLKSGLHRLTDRSLGKLRAGAAERGVAADEYAASLRCLLIPAHPQCRTRVFFGVGEGGLFRLRDGQWQDIEPRVDADTPGEPVLGFGSLPSETPQGDRLTMDLGIPTPPSPYEPAPEPPRDPFLFRASVARPGDALVMCTGGLADPLRGEPALCAYLARRWSGGTPPGLAAFLADAQVRVKGYADDRTAAAVWEA
ncbi:hypothetical protein GCM10011578_071180 [Streptomyces fuscichromogenes]|uniref:PPM-type phosphatase domain-containing protein n=1 Tax=Streptomyces fuscichromogenes TaxID=1324013 RepID=A0A917XK05_9ACTN|nr:hypothetical protein GCM10011578_071180 [Streptomyces fuscichromogenes]